MSEGPPLAGRAVMRPSGRGWDCSDCTGLPTRSAQVTKCLRLKLYRLIPVKTARRAWARGGEPAPVDDFPFQRVA
jgi:hypothetical protein